METGITKQQILTVLTKSAHGNLKEYVPVGRIAAQQEAEFLAHLIAYDAKNGQIRDAKVALPVTSLAEPTFDGELAENSFAHLALLDPRNLVRAVKFAKEVKTPNHGRGMLRLVERYLRAREDSPQWFERTAMQHRSALKTLYALCHIKPAALADQVLFKGAKIGVFHDIAHLKDMSAADAAAVITNKRIPFLVASGALGKRMQDTGLILAIIERMSPSELVTNAKMLEKMGVKTVPELRAAFQAGLKKVAESGKVTFKTTRAADALGDSVLSENLRGAQEKQLAKMTVEGNWLVIGDKSGSMSVAIDVARRLSGTLARIAQDVHLVFVDTGPRYLDVSGKDYDTILADTKRIIANGGTSLGCGLQYALEHNFDIDGIAIVSDSAENNPPMFAATYQKYAARFGKEPPVYLYKTEGEKTDALEHNCAHAGIELQVFDLRGGFDFYSLPAIVNTMRVSKYSLVDAVMEMPLLKVDDVFKSHVRQGA